VALRILNAAADSEPLLRQLVEAIQAALPGAVAEVRCASAGHFEIRVRSGAFAGLPKLKQHQLVYRAIAPFMSGDAPPVHAVDRLECQLP
jgi:stress-induced morphogen